MAQFIVEPKYYELHVTVVPERILEFGDFCKQTGAKPLYIQLDSGLHRHQPMLAVTKMLPDDKTARMWADDYRKMLDGPFRVTRVKLESRLVHGPNEYYEAHWKLDLSHNEHFWDCALGDLAKKHPHLLRSHNLLNTRIHYLSQRIYGSIDPIAANETFGLSGETIKSFYGMPLVKTHYERCVWDSNPALDYGWGE
jgi:hypothetical protein